MMVRLVRCWRFIYTGVSDAFSNMAIDEALLNSHLWGFTPPTLRLYRWSPPALSLGYFQSLDSAIDMPRCVELGVDVVRRITGGRAVLHHDELTYSIVASEKCGLLENIKCSYQLFNEGLIAAYGILGLEICLGPNKNKVSSEACFGTSGVADLTYQGRKIAGSAQFRKGHALLQHGSLPINHDQQKLFSILKFPHSNGRDKALRYFSQKVTSISEILGKRIGWKELKEAVLNGFQNALDIKFYEDTLTREEIDLSQKLVREKYSSFSWNHFGKQGKECMQNAITTTASLVGKTCSSG